jgi:hypothetical protein
MKATVKCSNCGAEITNLNFSWGKKQWLWFLPILPIMLIGFLPMWNLYQDKGNFRDDLHITVLEKRPNEKTYEILGYVENKGKVSWENINLDFDFFSPTGTFIDKASGRVNAVVMPGGKEYFKVVTPDKASSLSAEGVEMKSKVADAYTKPF